MKIVKTHCSTGMARKIKFSISHSFVLASNCIMRLDFCHTRPTRFHSEVQGNQHLGSKPTWHIPEVCPRKDSCRTRFNISIKESGVVRHLQWAVGYMFTWSSISQPVFDKIGHQGWKKPGSSISYVAKAPIDAGNSHISRDVLTMKKPPTRSEVSGTLFNP